MMDEKEANGRPMNDDSILKIENLFVEYKTSEDTIFALNGVSFSIKRGEVFGLVGETGAGKTTTALSILKLLPNEIGFIRKGSIQLEDLDLVAANEKTMMGIRGKRISMIFQDPMTSLNPVLTVGQQISESIELHTKSSRQEIQRKVDEVLQTVGISPSRKNEYPHQFSGGMKQRVVIAMALVCEPELLIADEPTTALDVTVQNQVLNLMRELKTKFNTAMLLITHDLGIVCQMCDTVAIMYAGEIIEKGSVYDIFDKNPKKHHQYTLGLFNSLPSLQVHSKRLKPVDGLMPDPTDLPCGCKFHTRCSNARELCRTVVPEAIEVNGHMVKCHRFSGKEVSK